MGLDVAIDLGTSRTRIYLEGKGKVVDEPSVITVDLSNDSIIAVGEDAYNMLGRTTERYNAVYPLSGGVISDLGLVEALISSFLKRVVSSKIGMPRAVACVPGEITDVEKRAVVNAISCAGIRRVCLIEEPVAAAIGAGLDISSPHGSFVVDVGGGTTDLAVISLSGIAVSRSIKQAGNVMDEEIIKYVKRRYNMLIGKRTGMPAWTELDSAEMVEPLRETSNAIVKQIQDVLEETPPELIGDIHTDGIILTGGASQLTGLDTLIKVATDLRVTVAEDAADCVIKGCGASLKYIDKLRKPDSGVNPISDRY